MVYLGPVKNGKRKAYEVPFEHKGKIYESLLGSCVQVKRGKAYVTSGGLKARGILINSTGRYVSASKYAWGKPVESPETRQPYRGA